MLYLGIVFLFFGQYFALRFESGKYVQTNVFQEPKTCQKNAFYNHLQTVSSFSLLDCGLKCSASTDCRRIMFDRKTKICLMFESGENCFHHENIEDKVCYRLKSICSDSVCTRCPIGYYGDVCQHIIQDCSDGSGRGVKQIALMSYIQPVQNGLVIEVKCDFNWGGLTFIQHRIDSCLETDFNRTRDEYVHGFGNKHGEYWLGLQNIYDILQNHNNFKFGVLVVLGSGNVRQGYYHNFTLYNSTYNFKFHSDKYSGHSQQPIGDSLTNGSYSIEGRPFSTYDRDYSNNDCPDRFKGGWWYLDDPICSRANPNGRRNDVNDEATIQWLDNFGFQNTIHMVQLRLMRYVA